MATVTQKEAMTIDDDDGDVGGTLVILPVAETSPPRMMTMGLRRIFKQGPPKPANEEHHEMVKSMAKKTELQAGAQPPSPRPPGHPRAIFPHACGLCPSERPARRFSGWRCQRRARHFEGWRSGSWRCHRRDRLSVRAGASTESGAAAVKATGRSVGPGAMPKPMVWGARGRSSQVGGPPRPHPSPVG